MFKYKLFGVVLAVAAAVAGCSKGEVATTASADAAMVAPPTLADAPPAAPSDDCTWQTKLEPGIPGSPGHLIPSPLNPNGQSELAALMREMETHMKVVRQAIVDGTPLPPVSDRQYRMRCTWPTTASDRNAAFDTFALNYNTALKALYDAPAGQPQRAAYDAVRATCRTCHENSCPGPIMAIDALSFERLETP